MTERVTDRLNVQFLLPKYAGMENCAYNQAISRACEQLLKQYWPRVGGLACEDWPPVTVSFYYDDTFFADGVRVTAEVPRADV